MNKILLIPLVLSAGCATTLPPQIVDGDLASAKIVSRFSVGSFEDGDVDFGNSDREALRRCRNWGYSQADRYEPEYEFCSHSNQYGCWRREYKLTYQCHN